MNILEKDLQTIKNFIMVAPLEVIRQFKIECEKNQNDEKIKQVLPLIQNRLA